MTTPIATNMVAVAESYHKLHWMLVPLAPGQKGPTGASAKGWQLRDHCIGPGQPFPSNMSIGLAHAYSQTCSIDIDDMARAIAWGLEQGIDITGLLNADDAVQIRSGVSNHGKLIYRLPDTHPTLPTATITSEKHHIL